MPVGFPYGLPPFFTPVATASTSGTANNVLIPATNAASIIATLPQTTAAVTEPLVHTLPQGININTQHRSIPVTKTMEEMMEELAKELRHEIQANRGNADSVKTQDLCLVSKVDVPKKFKIPDFDRYNGLTCPQNHIIKYVRKMGNYKDNDSLMIHCFQDSLMEDAAEWYTSLSKNDIHTFDELATAFKSHYGFNTRLRPNREFLRSLSQKKEESFREYAQRWRGAAARITPALDEEEMTQTFLKTLKKDYVERMIIAAPNNFSEMVTMGTRLEEVVRDGIIVFEKAESSVSASKRYGNGHHKKKETEVGMVSAGAGQSMATVAPINAAQMPPSYPYMPYSQHPFFPPFYHQYPLPPGQPQVPVNAIAQQMKQQMPVQQQQQNQQARPTFPPIPMLYAELLPTLLQRGHCTTRQGKPPPDPLPPRFRSDLKCDFHQGALGHDVEGCYALKYIVKKLIDQGKLTFENNVPHVLDNPLPNHAAVNMIEVCEEAPRLDVRNVATPLVPLHIKLCKASLFNHDHAKCLGCLRDPLGCYTVQEDIQSLMNDNLLTVSDVCVIVPVFHDPPVKSTPLKKNAEPLVIRLPGPIPYVSDKAVPYKYNATMIENGVEVPLASFATVSNIAEGTSAALRSGKVRPPLFQKKVATPTIPPVEEATPTVVSPIATDVNQSGKAIEDSNLDEILRIIKRSDYKIVDQLLQTPSKISVLSLLLSSEAHRNTLLKVLEQAYVDHEVTVDRFGGIVGNITACNNLWFSEEELPEVGKSHNLALHISVNCKSDMISNVLVDTGSSLNVMPKTTLDQLSYRGTPLRRSTFLVKAFDGSRKNVLGEIDLPITIGPENFLITFQVMDINASYSCLLGRPWIHDAGAVTSTLHQKLKFVRKGKLVTIHGEEAYLVSQLSSFSCIEAGSAEGTAFQGLTIEGAEPKKAGAAMASLKDAQKVIQEGQTAGWGKVVQLCENKRKEGLGFSPSSRVSSGVFHSAGFACICYTRRHCE
ncbi:putative retrotransposon gag domain, aspartic peptidase domain-containing protein [Medicago truncatula]|uniref:Putative retrotransposon gag domain, aspartic peptidase domain-containing protein n=1 Tax=Medicago truncatula TaxID=3880 RepID=A0A396HM73_MEDTR|nr:putative retrotransposon gag domain, aspartic peptidase domain-containing protein [Medicago truncatula]